MPFEIRRSHKIWPSRYNLGCMRKRFTYRRPLESDRQKYISQRATANVIRHEESGAVDDTQTRKEI